MTLFSTIAYERPTRSALAKPVVIASIAVALSAGVGLGLLASNIGDLGVISTAQGTPGFSALTHEQFLRMNTTDLDHLGATAADPFIIRNVDSYQGLDEAVESRPGVGSYFYEINTTALGSAVSDSPSTPAPGVDIIGDSEPFGHPNYGRLETYLGAQPTSGAR